MSKLTRSHTPLAAAPLLRATRPPVITRRLSEFTPMGPGETISPVPAQPALVDQGPNLDYSRSLTAAGGVLIIYKDLDLRWRHYAWKAVAWCAGSGAEAWYVKAASPITGIWLNLLCWLLVAGLNLWIVWQPVEVYRRIEIRPDCLILDGEEVFWREYLVGEGPQFQPDEKENLILGGVYGTRFVEFATLRRFDEFDRMPEAFAAHFTEAVQQLWEIP